MTLQLRSDQREDIGIGPSLRHLHRQRLVQAGIVELEDGGCRLADSGFLFNLFRGLAAFGFG
ncbi:hypothetical protein D9M73_258860 [compost metagenome]